VTLWNVLKEGLRSVRAGRQEAPPAPAARPAPAGAGEFVFHIDWALPGLLGLLSGYRFHTVLDVGSGRGEHTRLLRHFGKAVYSVDSNFEADYVGDFMQVDFDRQFDAVWCSHVLEHQRNVGAFLEKLRSLLVVGGVLAISVPVHPRERLIAGHLTSWNAGLLCYNLVLAGFDCGAARLLQTQDLSLLVTRTAEAPVLEVESGIAGGELGEADPFAWLRAYFPFPVEQSGNAEVLECNWGGYDYALPPAVAAGEVVIVGRFTPAGGLRFACRGPEA
jgi:SAM-dependent methyltransferase